MFCEFYSLSVKDSVIMDYWFILVYGGLPESFGCLSLVTM